MPGKLPIDRVREAQDAPKVYDEHRERFASHQAELRDADDPVSGARPDTVTDDPVGEVDDQEENGLDPDASVTQSETPDGP
ncbi:hypothetical protein BH23CHL8_BH23CHL8_13900 [soil metagenome]